MAGCGFRKLILHIRRSLVAMVEGAQKTEASLKDVLLDAQTAGAFFNWRQLLSIRASDSVLSSASRSQPNVYMQAVGPQKRDAQQFGQVAEERRGFRRRAS
jgi:hypothetical protein